MNKIIRPGDVLKKYGETYKIPNITKLASCFEIKTYLSDLLKQDNFYKIDKKCQEEFVRGLYIQYLLDNGSISKRIVIEDSQTESLKRFTIAYLLSRYLLGKIDNNFDFVIDNNYDKESLMFARDLLIPDFLYKNQKGNKDINYIQEYYNVPDFIAASKIKKFGGIK